MNAFQIFIRLPETNETDEFLKLIPLEITLPPWNNTFGLWTNITEVCTMYNMLDCGSTSQKFVIGTTQWTVDQHHSGL